MSVDQTNHGLTQLPSLHGSSNLARRGVDPCDPALPPPPSPTNLWSLLDLVSTGFEEKHEKRYWRFVQQRRMSTTLLYVNLRLGTSTASLAIFVRSLWGGQVYGLCCYLLFFFAPFLVTFVLCHKRQLDQLGWSMIFMKICRTLAYALPIFGLPDCFSPEILRGAIVPMESLIISHLEPVPMVQLLPVHLFMWLTLFLRNEHVVSNSISPFYLLAGHLLALAVQARADVQDRRAYIREARASAS